VKISCTKRHPNGTRHVETDRNFFKLFGEARLSLPRILWNSGLNLIITSGHVTTFYSDGKKNFTVSPYILIH